jgi:serine phosphatase RsbU (regulator of sigma subunit)
MQPHLTDGTAGRARNDRKETRLADTKNELVLDQVVQEGTRVHKATQMLQRQQKQKRSTSAQRAMQAPEAQPHANMRHGQIMAIVGKCVPQADGD